MALMMAPCRLAVAGDELVVVTFDTGIVGLASAADLRRRQGSPAGSVYRICRRICSCFYSLAAPPVRAVFVPPGARVLVRGISPALQRECGFQEEVEQADFTWILDSRDCVRDAVRFQNGVAVLVTRLSPGQSLRVLDCSSEGDRAAVPAGRRRAVNS